MAHASCEHPLGLCAADVRRATAEVSVWLMASVVIDALARCYRGIL